MVMPGVTMRKASVNFALCGLASLLRVCQAMSMAMTTVLPLPVAILQAMRYRRGLASSLARRISFSIQLLIFTANPEDYTARGKIITPLKDRIGSEIRTHYPAVLEQGIAITQQEAWLDRPSPVEVRVPDYIRRVVEQLAFLAREDKRVDKRSGVSQRLPISVMENVVSNAERRALG